MYTAVPSSALFPAFKFLPYQFKHLRADDGFVVAFRIVLWNFAFVDLFLLGEEVHGAGFLYVNENGNTLAIYKLTHNIPLSNGDYQELERVLTGELGSREDYQREFGDTPFGLLIRKIAKMDHEAAMAAFSRFINDQSLNQKQIAFVTKIINHIEQNGYMESVTLLTKPPFDKPLSFTKLFDKKTQTAIMAAINKVRDNAVVINA